jgi:hypothetical protein
MLADAITGRTTQIVALAGLGWVTWTVWSYVTSPLRKYPGPFLAGEFLMRQSDEDVACFCIRLSFLHSVCLSRYPHGCLSECDLLLILC